MAENPWYPFYIGDYQQKTSHLTLIEHGAYGLLLNHYYATHHALPGSRKTIYRICRATDRNERRAVDSVLDQFFTVFDTEIEPNPDRVWVTSVTNSGIYFVHRKCEFEICKQLNYSKSQSANAQKRHSNRHMPNTMPDSCQTDARARVPQPQPEKKELDDDRAKPPSDAFQTVYDLGVKLFPNLAAQNTSLIQMWIESGMDVEKDILPEIKRIHGKGVKVRGWGLFTQDIADANAKRLKPMPKGNDHETNKQNFTGSTKANKTQRVYDAVRRAAESGGFASGSESETETSDNAGPIILDA